MTVIFVLAYRAIRALLIISIINCPNFDQVLNFDPLYLKNL